MPQISEQLARLAGLVRAPFAADPQAFAGRIDDAMAGFAVRRHRTGPLLHVAAQAPGAAIDAPIAALLAEHYRRNAMRQAMADAFLCNIAARFHAAQVPWLVFKGLPFYRKIYPDPAWRQAHDIDVLVPPASFDAAVALFSQSGMTLTNTRLDPDHWIERWMASIAKDVMLVQAGSNLHVELHRRLFLARAEEEHNALLRDAFRPRQSRDAADVPTQDPGAGSLLYLLLHGASSRWFRLKWLADLVPLLARTDAVQSEAMIAAAEATQSVVTAKAGLILADTVFPGVVPQALRSWIAETAGRGKARERAQLFLAALNDPTATTGSRPNVRFDALAMHVIFDSPGYRTAVLARGGAWVIARTLRDVWPGEI